MSTAPIETHATTDSAAKLAVLQRRMAIVFTKGNAAKIAEEVKDNAAKISEKIKESEALNEMIKESTLDNLLVGKGTLDRLLAEEEEEWPPMGDRNEVETAPAAKGPRDSKLNGSIWHEVVESGVLNAADYRPTSMMNSIHSIVQGRHSKNPIENLGSGDEKENMAPNPTPENEYLGQDMAPNPTPENEYLGQDSYLNESSSYLKALGRTGGSTIAAIGSSSVITDMRLAQYFNAEKLGQLGALASGAGGAVLDMVKDPLARNVEIPYAQQHLAMKTEGQWTLASNRGRNSVKCGGESPNIEGNYEMKLILDLCPPDGTKTDPNITCPALLDALEEGNPWMLRAKTLCVIETVLKVEAERLAGVGCFDSPYTDYFRRCSGPFEHLANHPRDGVSGPAKRVLVALGLIVVEFPPLFDEAEAHPNAAAATAEALPPSQAVVSSVAIVGLAGTSLFSEFNTKAVEQMQYLQKAYQENKEKILLQPTNFQARGRAQVPSFSSWNPIPARSSTHENPLNAL